MPPTRFARSNPSPKFAGSGAGWGDPRRRGVRACARDKLLYFVVALVVFVVLTVLAIVFGLGPAVSSLEARWTTAARDPELQAEGLMHELSDTGPTIG